MSFYTSLVFSLVFLILLFAVLTLALRPKSSSSGSAVPGPGTSVSRTAALKARLRPFTKRLSRWVFWIVVIVFAIWAFGYLSDTQEAEDVDGVSNEYPFHSSNIGIVGIQNSSDLIYSDLGNWTDIDQKDIWVRTEEGGKRVTFSGHNNDRYLGQVGTWYRINLGSTPAGFVILQELETRYKKGSENKKVYFNFTFLDQNGGDNDRNHPNLGYSYNFSASDGSGKTVKFKLNLKNEYCYFGTSLDAEPYITYHNPGVRTDGRIFLRNEEVFVPEGIEVIMYYSSSLEDSLPSWMGEEFKN